MNKILKILFFISPLCMPLYLWHVSVFKVPTNIFELIICFAIFGWIFKEIRIIKQNLKYLPKNILFSIILLLIGLLLAIFLNGITESMLGILKSWFILPILFGFIVFSQIKSAADINKILFSVYLSGLIVSIIAIYYKFSGLVTFDGRLQAFYGSPNYLAMFLAPSIIIGVYFLINIKKSNHLYLIVASLFTIIAPFFLTYSYSAWIAVFIACIFLIKNTFSTNKKAFGIITIILCFIIVLISQLGSQKFSDAINVSSRSSITSRIIIWRSAMHMIKDNPIFGIGPGNFQKSYLNYQKYYPPYLEWAAPQPHNVFLAFWLQTGLIGFFAFLLIIFNILKLLFVYLNNKKTACLAELFVAFFIYTLINGLSDTTYWKNDLAILFWLFIFLTLSLKKIMLNFEQI